MRLDARELSLAPAGEAELFELGRRLRRRVPRLLHSVRPKPGELEMRCTDMTRSVLSAKSFLRGFLNFSGEQADCNSPLLGLRTKPTDFAGLAPTLLVPGLGSLVQFLHVAPNRI